MAKVEDIQVDDKLIEAFHLMYDYFPEGVQLVHKSKRIIALNSACASFGRHVGMVCSKHGPPEHHKGCLANKTLKGHKACLLYTSLRPLKPGVLTGQKSVRGQRRESL